MCSVYAILRRHSYISNIKWYIKTKLVLWWNIIEIEVVESVLLEYKQASDVWILVIVYSGLHCCRQQSTSPHPVYCYIEGPFSKSKLKDSKSEIKEITWTNTKKGFDKNDMLCFKERMFISTDMLYMLNWLICLHIFFFPFSFNV